MLRDSCGRPVSNLRISVTRECNQRCLYCHREGERAGRSPDSMSARELERVAGVAASLGITKVKFTGGEPLTRPDLPRIIRRVAPFFRDVSLTTNGTLLAGLAAELKKAGLGRVNVSLDTVRPGTYRRITLTRRLEDAVAGVRAAVAAGLVPVKLNMVVLRGLNEREVPDMLRFASAEGAVLQLIELEAPKGGLSGEFYTRYHADLMDAESWLQKSAIRTEQRRMHHRRRYLVPVGAGRTVEVEVVRPVHNTEFCANCNRLRLSSDGRVVPCLFRGDLGVDILGPLRKGVPDGELAKLFLEAVSRRAPYWSGAEPPVGDQGGELGACP
jgi:cyclic pyranopterin phosphate synthase